LLNGPKKEIIKILKTMVEQEHPAKIASVGDQTTQDLADHSLPPDILIVDNKIMRKEIPPISATAELVVNVKNPAGTITEEAWLAVEKAARNPKRTKIIVEGEEDLLALVAIIALPENSIVLYGQPPHKGIVVVKANSQNKRRVQEIIAEMTQK
jgi:hypothetical protein